MRVVLLAVTLALLTSATAFTADPVLLTSRRGGWIEAFDPATLATVFRASTPANTESVAADPSGTRFYLSAPKNPGEGCCALYALDLDTQHLTYLNFPVLRATPSSGRVYMQRGNVGIESFDSSTLERRPTWKAPGVYNLQPSPDGTRIFGVTNFPSPSLDLFAVVQGERIASQPLSRTSRSPVCGWESSITCFRCRADSPLSEPSGWRTPNSVRLCRWLLHLDFHFRIARPRHTP